MYLHLLKINKIKPTIHKASEAYTWYIINTVKQMTCQRDNYMRNLSSHPFLIFCDYPKPNAKVQQRESRGVCMFVCLHVCVLRNNVFRPCEAGRSWQPYIFFSELSESVRHFNKCVVRVYIPITSTSYRNFFIFNQIP